MTKKEIKACFKRLKYFHNTLLMNEKAVSEIKNNEKSIRRLYKEGFIVQRLMAVAIYENLPTDYLNPSTVLTKQQALVLMSSEKTKSDGIFSRGGISMIYMSKEEFELYREVYLELLQR